MPWCPVDQILEPVDRVEDTSEGRYLEGPDRSIRRGNDHVSSPSI
jgi:hypothetical protein